ncbi:MAG: PEP-CTERM sorting domain-containing protein [Phycisphaerales bacterium]|nr:PEP-CTERM sorting domain-containing protein [Phycisphaerales bacterium]
MLNRILATTLIAILAAATTTNNASASLFEWNWTPASTDGSNIGYNSYGGDINSIHGEFDSTTQTLKWLVNYKNESHLDPEGFTLALNNGPNPKGHAGELALIYFDATRSTPVLTAYGYNGQNSTSTFYDGSERAGNQTPDMIGSSRGGAGWITNLIDRRESDNSITLGFEIDASGINGHTPMHPGPGGLADWFGVGFDNSLGIWMHSFRGLDTNYAGDFLTQWSAKKEGWLDGCNFTTTPEPGTIALLGLGGWALIRRRNGRTA